jgi:hypothetical protein
MIRLLLLLALAFNMEPLQSTTLTVPTLAGSTHAVVVWCSGRCNGSNVMGKQKISNTEYAALNGPGERVPARPPLFPGNQAEWVAAWRVGAAMAYGGRRSVNTSSGEYEKGHVKVYGNGAIEIYPGADMDVDPPIVLRRSQYTGTAPNITVTGRQVCGLTITAGTISGVHVKGCR